MAEIAQPLLPGERLLHGRVVCFDMGMRLDFLACMAAIEAPDDFTALSEEDLTRAVYQGIRVWELSSGIDDRHLRKATAERVRRNAIQAERVAA